MTSIPSRHLWARTESYNTRRPFTVSVHRELLPWLKSKLESSRSSFLGIFLIFMIKKCTCWKQPVQSQTRLCSSCSCVCTVWCAQSMSGCMFLAHVCDASILCGWHLLQGVGKSRGGGLRWVLQWQTFTTKPCCPALCVPMFWGGRPCGLSSVHPPGCWGHLWACWWTPDPSPWDYVHTSLGFMEVREGLGGTSGFKEGIRFNSSLLSKL